MALQFRYTMEQNYIIRRLALFPDRGLAVVVLEPTFLVQLCNLFLELFLIITWPGGFVKTLFWHLFVEGNRANDCKIFKRRDLIVNLITN